MNIHWIKYPNGEWINLLTIDLNQGHFNDMAGVYIIWSNSSQPRTIRVGQGFIRDRLSDHRQDPNILQYQNFGVFVTWARINSSQLNGVERYLADVLRPLYGSRYPDVIPIEVNLPW